MQEWYKNNEARKKYQFPYLKIVEVPYNLSYGLFPLPNLDSDSDSDTRFLYYADTMGKGSESESESVETCSA